MIPKRTKAARLGCLAGLLLGLAGGFFLAVYYQNAISCHGDTAPLKTLAVTIDPGQDPQLVEQARRFAYKNNFRFDVGDDQPASEFRILMIRKDVEVMAKSLSNPGGYEIKFYNYDCLHPTPIADIEELVNDFKGFIREIPSVTITEKN